MDAAASGGHFNVYTASVMYGGVGATEFGVTRSKLWNPFDSEMNGGEEKSKEFAECLSGVVEIVKAYRQALAGRFVICDCGLDWLSVRDAGFCYVTWYCECKAGGAFGKI